jgi:hypothetical protein
MCGIFLGNCGEFFVSLVSPFLLWSSLYVNDIINIPHIHHKEYSKKEWGVFGVFWGVLGVAGSLSPRILFCGIFAKKRFMVSKIKGEYTFRTIS